MGRWARRNKVETLAEQPTVESEQPTVKSERPVAPAPADCREISLGGRVALSPAYVRLLRLAAHLAPLNVAHICTSQPRIVRCVVGLIHAPQTWRELQPLCIADPTGCMPMVVHPDVRQLHVERLRDGVAVVLRDVNVFETDGGRCWLAVCSRSLAGLLEG
ncbi:MAG: hypothetical protein KVP17_000736 [Porospora cf. gigantea B]|uniref:uncharacterized protein n=1 Tax=Porospora cf. gigantea B TaxID=2853592 RepID=UPI003571DD3D|nr:MAG: hypothetical protein KVP17_000736 [Porospora cf. gigantea B]